MRILELWQYNVDLSSVVSILYVLHNLKPTRLNDRTIQCPETVKMEEKLMQKEKNYNSGHPVRVYQTRPFS